MARKSRVSVRIDEEAVPIRKSVRSASTMLGIDPLQVANEGKVVMGVPEEDAERILQALRSHHYGHDAAIIGEGGTRRPCHYGDSGGWGTLHRAAHRRPGSTGLLHMHFDVSACVAVVGKLHQFHADKKCSNQAKNDRERPGGWRCEGEHDLSEGGIGQKNGHGCGSRCQHYDIP